MAVTWLVKRVSWSDSETDNAENPNMTESLP
jgi:hypothetical protein